MQLYSKMKFKLMFVLVSLLFRISFSKSLNYDILCKSLEQSQMNDDCQDKQWPSQEIDLNKQQSESEAHLIKQLLDALISSNAKHQQKQHTLEEYEKNQRQHKHVQEDDDDEKEFQKRASYKNNQKLAFQGLIGKLQSSG